MTSAHHTTAVPLSGHVGATLVKAYLEREGWHFQLFEHKPTFRAVDEALAGGVPPYHALKTVVLHDGGRLVLAVIPASERLDLHKVRAALGDRRLHLAAESEIEFALPSVEVGAVPPLGPLFSLPVILDHRLLRYSRVVCGAGDHSHSLLLIPEELVDKTGPAVADICED